LWRPATPMTGFGPKRSTWELMMFWKYRFDRPRFSGASASPGGSGRIHLDARSRQATGSELIRWRRAKLRRTSVISYLPSESVWSRRCAGRRVNSEFADDWLSQANEVRHAHINQVAVSAGIESDGLLVHQAAV